MRKLFFLILFLCSFFVNAQEQSFQFDKTPLSEIISDLEDRFDVRFSYKSNLITGENFTYNKQTTLKEFLNAISEEKNLEFIFLGKENIVIKSSFDVAFDANKLEEVVLVTEYLTAGFDQNKKDGSVTMNPNKLGILPGLTEPDVLQSLQLLPGISSPTESAANLHIRGGTPDQNLILYDGIKIYHQGHMFGMISPFNPYIVENVNVFRSGTKAQFGDRIAGVIDINSLNEVPKELSGGGGLNFLHMDAFIKAPLQNDKIGLVLSARRSVNDIVNLPTFNSFSDKVFQNTKIEFENDLAIEEELDVLSDEFTFLDVNTKLIFTPNEYNKISISGLLVDNNLNYANADFEGEGTRDQLDLSNSGVSAQWKYTPKGNWSLESTIRYSVFDSSYSFTEFSNDFDTDFQSNTNTVKDLGIQLQGGYSVNSKTKVFFGYEFVNYDVAYRFDFNEAGVIETDEFKNKFSGHNFYTEGQITLDDLYIRGGFRTSLYQNTNDFFFEPRLYADYKVSDIFKLKASAEIKNQAISQLISFEFNDLGLGDTVWALYSEEEGVPILNNQQVTFGFFLDQNGWKLDVEGYHKKVKGLTSLTRGFSSGVSNDGNYVSGNSTVVGVDVLIKKKINRFRTWLGYSFSKNDFEFPNLQIGKFPGNFDQRHVLSWSGSCKYNQFQFSLGWQYATGRPYSVATGIIGDDEIQYAQQNNARIGDYHKLDASAFYDFYLDSNNKVKARIGASIINLYNRDNEIDRTFVVDEDESGNNTLFEQTNVGLGITPNLVFRIYF